VLDDLVDLFRAEAAVGTCPHARADHHDADPSASRPDAAADGGSCDGAGGEFREPRFSRRSSSATRASSRWFASGPGPASQWIEFKTSQMDVPAVVSQGIGESSALAFGLYAHHS
jgi:hypothetical protein